MQSLDRTTRDILGIIREKMRKEELILDSYPRDQKRFSEASSRLRVLNDQLARLKLNEIRPKKNLFLSYSISTKTEYISYLRERALERSFILRDAYTDYD